MKMEQNNNWSLGVGGVVLRGNEILILTVKGH